MLMEPSHFHCVRDASEMVTDKGPPIRGVRNKHKWKS